MFMTNSHHRDIQRSRFEPKIISLNQIDSNFFNNIQNKNQRNHQLNLLLLLLVFFSSV